MKEENRKALEKINYLLDQMRMLVEKPESHDIARSFILNKKAIVK